MFPAGDRQRDDDGGDHSDDGNDVTDQRRQPEQFAALAGAIERDAAVPDQIGQQRQHQRGDDQPEGIDPGIHRRRQVRRRDIDDDIAFDPQAARETEKSEYHHHQFGLLDTGADREQTERATDDVEHRQRHHVEKRNPRDHRKDEVEPRKQLSEYLHGATP